MPGTRRKKFTQDLIGFYTLVGLIFIFDQLTKILALSRLQEVPSLSVIPNIFHLTLVYNKGIAFGWFNRHESVLLAVISISLAVLLWLSLKAGSMTVLVRTSFAFILAGAMGNWLDRVRLGFVVDFLDFRVWPVFNVADSFITVGVVLYFLHLIRGEKPA